jgi:hypothetical protein
MYPSDSCNKIGVDARYAEPGECTDGRVANVGSVGRKHSGCRGGVKLKVERQKLAIPNHQSSGLARSMNITIPAILATGICKRRDVKRSLSKEEEHSAPYWMHSRRKTSRAWTKARCLYHKWPVLEWTIATTTAVTTAVEILLAAFGTLDSINGYS